MTNHRDTPDQALESGDDYRDRLKYDAPLPYGLSASVSAGDFITMAHPNGDRLGPRKLILEWGPGGASWLTVDAVGDIDPTVPQAKYSKSLHNLQQAGWFITSVQRAPRSDKQ